MSSQGLQLKTNSESRHHRRVKVALKGALRLPGFGVEMICTKNISEGGIALTTLSPCAVELGSEVQLHLKGVVTNNEHKQLKTYTMKVVHADNNNLGLVFV